MATIESREVPHRWAHGLDDSEELRGAASIFARGDTIYSYSEPIGRRINGSLFLVNNAKHSVTTSKHQGWVLAAIPSGARSIELAPGDDYAGTWNALAAKNAGPAVEWYSDEISRLMRECVKPGIRETTRASLMRKIDARFEDWLTCHKVFGLRCTQGAVRAPKHDLAEIRKQVAEHDAMVARANRRKLEAENKRKAERAAKAKSLVSGWRRGRPSYNSTTGANVRDLGYPVFRASDGVLESSQGATVPLAEAKRLWKMLPRLRKRGAAPEQSVGHYGQIAAEADALVVGCHRIPWAEVEATAKHCGW